MVRGREFDEDEVLRQAMHSFRARGYGGVSISELETATGISSGSLYNSYGDKRGIFLASFAHYLSSVLDQRIQRHAPASKGLAGVRHLFLSLLDEPNGEKSGCLITNTAIEFGAADTMLAASVQKGFSTLEQLFTERLADRPHPQLTAIRLLALYQGVLVLFRAGYDARKIRRVINLEFDSMQEEAR